MSVEIQVGTKSVVWGLTTGATGTGVGTFTTQSADFAVKSEKAVLKNERGATITEIYFDPSQTLKMEVVPTSTTLALAKAANILPVPGTIVTVTDADDTELTGTNSGKYLFQGGSKKKSNTGMTILTFELLQYMDNDTAVVIV